MGVEMITQRVDVLGVSVDPVEAVDIIERISGAVSQRRRLLVGHHNLHSAYLVRHRPEMQAFYDRADLVYVDGMPLVLADRRGSGVLQRQHRSTLLDWIEPLLARAQREGWSVYLLGGAPAVIERTAAVFARRHPGAAFSFHHGYFEGVEAEATVLRDIDAVSPDLLLVGMGMPRQEIWLARHFDRLDVRAAISIGGLFDYFAGASATPPRWMGRLGLEWLGRLVADPRRLGHRYLVEPMLLAAELVRERRR
jgi:N-acetylglucosaminyldiphosphoundecaprenol N-acetyl-beta-D-mannosaminyltransferase